MGNIGTSPQELAWQETCLYVSALRNVVGSDKYHVRGVADGLKRNFTSLHGTSQRVIVCELILLTDADHCWDLPSVSSIWVPLLEWCWNKLDDIRKEEVRVSMGTERNFFTREVWHSACVCKSQTQRDCTCGITYPDGK